MAEVGKTSRYVCKWCSEKFPCGKSLEGHMRSHVVVDPAEFEEKVELSMKKNLFLNESGNGQTGYGLRENPKKTWRAVDARYPLPQENVCKQCGKGFHSMKALCGHMACHSDKDKGAAFKDDQDHSWTSENQKTVLDSQSDSETEEKRLRTRPSKSRKCKKIFEDFPFVSASNGGSSVSEIDGQEQEGAKCLMMLSRDSGSKGGVNSFVESSDNNSIVVERTEAGKLGDGSLDCETTTMKDSDSDYFLDECGKGESDASSVGWFRNHGGFSGSLKSSMNAACDDDGMTSKCGAIESSRRKYGYENQESWKESPRMLKNGGGLCKNPQKKSKYECFNCKKVFKSYQALGGHRPCTKRICESRDESGENSPDDAAYFKTNIKFVESSSKSQRAEKKSNNKNNKAHVCPFCDRVFKNGQALGGHKRSHFLTGHGESNNRASRVEKPEHADLLDLNLPAPEADEDEGGG